MTRTPYSSFRPPPRSTPPRRGAVTFAGVGSACNVIWQVGSSATLGANTQLLGSILAFTSITSGAGSNIAGRLLAEGGAVTIDSNDITVPVVHGADHDDGSGSNDHDHHNGADHHHDRGPDNHYLDGPTDNDEHHG